MSQRFYKSKLGHIYGALKSYHNEHCKKTDKENIACSFRAGLE